MVQKDKVCQMCGALTDEKQCPNCNSNKLLEKYKGKIIIFDAKRSKLAKDLNIENNGKYALKYN